MPEFVKKIDIIGLYQRFDILHKFQPGINIIYGINGTGKTTILHILANILNGDYRRFLYLDFHSIEVFLDDDSSVKIIKEEPESIELLKPGDRRGKIIRESSNNSKHEPLLSSAYFPAFRTMIEAWASVEDNNLQEIISRDLYEQNQSNKLQAKTTQFSRKLFGNFVPQLNYPSPLEIEFNLSNIIRNTIINIARVDREVLSQSFIDIFAALSPINLNTNLEKAEAILEQIKSLSKEIERYPLQDSSMLSTGAYTKLREMLHSVSFDNTDSKQIVGVLSIYRNSLQKIVNILKESFVKIDAYLGAVNEFLEGKKIVYAEDTTLVNSFIKLRFSDGVLFSGLSALSSGERQIITLIYAASTMSQQKLVLIDEPEISLHIDWQRLLLLKMSEQLQQRQIIACTHSPMIAADYQECLTELQLKPTDTKRWYYERYQDQTNVSDNDVEFTSWIEEALDDKIIENFDVDVD